MHPSEYQELSLRTVPPDLQFWRDDCTNPEWARGQLFCNCALGLAGEAAEIDETPSSDEVGDGYWYAYIMARTLDAEPREPSDMGGDPQRELYRAASTLCELAKKHVFHGREFDALRQAATIHLWRCVDALAAIDEQPAPQTREDNVNKLRARYPDGFFERG
jgi:hypothetical protein